jgi:hypothetical protein
MGRKPLIGWERIIRDACKLFYEGDASPEAATEHMVNTVRDLLIKQRTVRATKRKKRTAA